MLVKNQIYEAEITDYTAEGQGVAHIEGCAVFIPNAVAGEKVRVRVEKAQKTWAAGKIVEILEKSPHRVNRECEVAKLCGGCDFWHMDYAEETRLKAERVKNCLNRIGGENLAEVPILAAPDCHGYRNKAQYPVAVKKGRAYAGFYRAGTHDVVENARCRILPEEIDAAKDAVGCMTVTLEIQHGINHMLQNSRSCDNSFFCHMSYNKHGNPHTFCDFH